MDFLVDHLFDHSVIVDDIKILHMQYFSFLYELSSFSHNVFSHYNSISLSFLIISQKNKTLQRTWDYKTSYEETINIISEYKIETILEYESWSLE